MYIRKPENETVIKGNTAWKVFKYYVVFSSPNTGKYGPEKIPCLDTSPSEKFGKDLNKIETEFPEGEKKMNSSDFKLPNVGNRSS